jgi:hypothetical protein
MRAVCRLGETLLADCDTRYMVLTLAHYSTSIHSLRQVYIQYYSTTTHILPVTYNTRQPCARLGQPVLSIHRMSAPTWTASPETTNSERYTLAISHSQTHVASSTALRILLLAPALPPRRLISERLAEHVTCTRPDLISAFRFHAFTRIPVRH